MRRHTWTAVVVLLVSTVVTLPSSARPPTRGRVGAPAGADATSYGARAANRPAAPGDDSRRLIPRTHTIERGETVAGVLSRFDVGSDQVARLVDSVTERWDVRKAQVGSQLELTVDSSTGTVEGLVVETDDERRVEVSRAPEGFVSRVVPADSNPVAAAASGEPSAAEAASRKPVETPVLAAAPAPVVKSATFRRGDTLGKVLGRLGLDGGASTRVAATVAKTWNVRRADIGTKVDLTFDAASNRPVAISILESRPGSTRVDIALSDRSVETAVAAATAPEKVAETVPEKSETPAPSFPAARTATLAQGGTVSGLLGQLGISAGDSPKVVSAVRGKWNLRRAQVGTVVQLSLDSATGQATGLVVRQPQSRGTLEIALPAGIQVAGAAPDSGTGSVAAPPPATAQVAKPSTATVHEAVLDRGETLGEVLADLGVGSDDVPGVSTTVGRKWNVRTAKPGTRVRLVMDESSGRATAVEIAARAGAAPLRVSLGAGIEMPRPATASATPAEASGKPEAPAASKAGASPASPDKESAANVPRFRVAAGQVQGSFYDAAAKAGLDPASITELAGIFAGEVDLKTDVNRGDRFRVLIEAPRADARRARGRILAAEITTGRDAHRVFMVTNGDGRPEYYNDQARTARRPFLRSPLDVTKVTSPFSMGRYHPILGYERPHLGVDLSAPKGTPIHSVGDGVVEYAGWRDGGDGRYLKVRHDGTYATSFSHLSAFAPGIREGKKVKRGQVIGFTGTTGLSTGPHLHFAFLKNDQYMDPMRVSITGGKVLTGKERREFDGIRAARLAALNSASGNGNSQVALAGR